MAVAKVNLSEQEQLALKNLAQRTGKSPDELIHEAVRQLIGQSDVKDRLLLLKQAQGMWKDRTDLPTLDDLRREWERPSRFEV